MTPHRRRVIEAAIQLTRVSLELKLERSKPANRLGRLQTDAGSEPVSVTQLRDAQRVGYAVFRAASLLPWHPTCLRQAIAVKRMLGRRGIASQLQLGVGKPALPEAHAWVTVQGQPVIGHGELERFTVLAEFE